MIEIIIYILIGLGLSVDAFLASIVYGTIISNKEKIFVVTIIGLLHFIMPIIGSYIANIISNLLIIKSKYIVILIFLFLIVGIIRNDNNNDKINIISYLSLFIMCIAVSIDSFSVGIALTLSNSKIRYAALIFSIISASSTLIGIKIGSYITQKYNNKVKTIEITLIIIVILKYIIFE